MKSLVLKTWSFVLLLLVAGALHAQAACPPGTVPYGTGNDLSVCGPDNSQQQQTPQQRPPQPPPAQWADRWGAIATDFSRAPAIVSVIDNQLDRSSAEHAALSDCIAKGGAACKIEISYGNQCAALVAGDKGHDTRSGATLDAAIQAGVNFCQSSGDSNCKAYFSGCSLPVRIQ